MNTHQELIEEKVAELIKKVRSINSECAFEAEEKFAYQQGFQDAIAMFYIDLTGTPKTKGTMQATIDTVSMIAREEEAVKYNKIIERAVASERKRITDNVKDWRRGLHMFCNQVDTFEEAHQQILKALTPLNKEEEVC